MGMNCHEHQYDGPGACSACLVMIRQKIDTNTLTSEDYPLLKELLSWS